MTTIFMFDIIACPKKITCNSDNLVTSPFGEGDSGGVVNGCGHED
jgi:hypothetical protein